MKLYNRGSRTINPNTPIAIHPGKWSPDLEEIQAEKLLKMFPRDLTSSVADAEKINSDLAKLKQENDELKAANGKLRSEVAGLESLLTGVSQENDELKAALKTPAPEIVGTAPVAPVAPPAPKAAAPAPAAFAKKTR